MDDNVETPDIYVRKTRSRTGVLRIDVCEQLTNRVLLTCKVRVVGCMSDCPERICEIVSKVMKMI